MREAAALMEMAAAVDPRPGRVPEQDLLNPRNLSAMAAELCIVFGKILWGLGFFVDDDFMGIGGGRGGARGAEASCGRGPP